MILVDKSNDSELMAFVPSIKRNMAEWKIINVRIGRSSNLTSENAVDLLLVKYKTNEGLIYVVGKSKVVLLVRMGFEAKYSSLKADVEKVIPQHAARVSIRKMSAAGLKQIQIDLTAKDNDSFLRQELFDVRDSRQENVIMIADDDLFVHKTMEKILSYFGTVVKVQNGNDIFSSYLQHNPDILFLDIHMPGKTGFEVMEEVMDHDSDGFIVMLSADSLKDNVLEAIEKGASGFLSKPPNIGRVHEYINQCITIK